MPIPPADVFGVVYIIENAQQFWSGAHFSSYIAAHRLTSSDVELEDMLNIADGLTLERLDATLRRFISFCAAYHGECSRGGVCAPADLPAKHIHYKRAVLSLVYFE